MYKLDVQRVVHRSIISIVKPTRCTNVSNLFYFRLTLYMFRTVFPSIIRSSRLCIEQPDACCCMYSLGVQDCTYTIHVSDGLSVHHQEFKTVVHTATKEMPVAVCTVLEFKTVHTLYMFRAVFPSIISSSRLYIHYICFGRSFRP